MSNSFYIIGRTSETALLVSENKFNYTYNWDVLIKKKIISFQQYFLVFIHDKEMLLW